MLEAEYEVRERLDQAAGVWKQMYFNTAFCTNGILYMHMSGCNSHLIIICIETAT